MTISRKIPWILYPLVLVAAFWLGRITTPQPLPEGQMDRPADIQIRLQDKGVLTRPLLECEVRQYAPGRKELRFFKTALQSFLADIEKSRQVEQVAVYFRDLDNGPWMGVKEEKRFTPASLFKVPLIIGCYKQAESDPSFLERKINFQGLRDPVFAGQVFTPEKMLEPGRTYTVSQLIELAAVYSDNGAALLLYENVDRKILQQVCLDLGIDPAEVLGPVSTLSAEAYGRFFRILYNASYLSLKDSEAILELFSRSTFRAGLVAGVPGGVVVSHKFGERGERSGSGKLIQLHDCGIVYHPQRPYLLCVMTEGYDFTAMAEAIEAVSRFVFESVSEQGR